MTLDFQHARDRLPAEATRSAAWQALEGWQQRVAEYASRRNFDLPGHPWVSQLSAYVTHRLLLEQELIGSLWHRHAPSDIRAFTDQVCWRTYWKGWLEQHPDVWAVFRQDVERMRDDGDEALAERRLQAESGRTGIACFDAWVEELRSTGYLHNHARMWFASIWIFTLRLPWQLGADFFGRHLLDGDAAANTLSWRWVAGLHTPGKHYLARAENIRHFTDQRFYPRGELEEDAGPLRETRRFELCELRPSDVSTDSLLPDLSESPAGLVVTGDDLSPECGILSDAPFQSIAAFAPNDLWDACAYSDRLRSFKREALADAAHRAAHHWGGTLFQIVNLTEAEMSPVPPRRNVSVHAPMRIYAGEVDRWVTAVTHWARRERLRAVRMFEPPVGPWRDLLPALRSSLRRHGVSLRCYRRRWDELHWPHARRGFFSFRRGLPERLERFFAEEERGS